MADAVPDFQTVILPVVGGVAAETARSFHLTDQAPDEGFLEFWEARMICRLWRGWTSRGNADRYERIVRDEVIPAIEAREIAGFRHIDLMRRDLGAEVEFQTLMWFDSLDAIRSFVGEDHTVSHVPLQARAVLERFDERATHYEVIDRREQ